jgi:hypothetical protein
MKHSLTLLAVTLTAAVSTVMVPTAFAQAQAARTENKNVTFVAATATSDGSSEISREKIEDCILSLPDPQKLEAQVSSKSVYVQGINGETGKNDWIKSYSARLDITYMTRETDLIIVTTRSVQGQPPVFREVDKTLRHTQTFTSNSTEGDLFAGRSNRQYHFTSAESATRDVKDRARVWISQQAAGVCAAR